MNLSLRTLLLHGLFLLSTHGNLFTQTEKTVLLYNNNSDLNYLTSSLSKHGITTKIINNLDPKNTSNLYIINNVCDIPQSSLPTYYIAYQTKSFDNYSPEMIESLSSAICVWETSLKDLNLYKNTAYNYYYFPKNYDFEDPIVLSCKLPLEALKTYKELLIYSNKVNTDISSHLPTLFAQTLLRNPKIIIEAGVRGGESSKAFSKASLFCQAQLIGIDISYCSNPYEKLPNAKFFLMDDLLFPSFFTSCQDYINKKADLIFIDTSHTYEQTKAEIKQFVPLLSNYGCLMFHDSNVTPLVNNTTYTRINGTNDYAPGNPIGEVRKAIEDYFAISFDPNIYNNFLFNKNDTLWHLLHYPFCNGLTIIEKFNA